MCWPPPIRPASTVSSPAAFRWARRSRCASPAAIPDRVAGLVLVRPAWTFDARAGEHAADRRGRRPHPRPWPRQGPDDLRAIGDRRTLCARGARQSRLAARLFRPAGCCGVRACARRHRRRRTGRFAKAMPRPRIPDAGHRQRHGCRASACRRRNTGRDHPRRDASPRSPPRRSTAAGISPSCTPQIASLPSPRPISGALFQS